MSTELGSSDTFTGYLLIYTVRTPYPLSKYNKKMGNEMDEIQEIIYLILFSVPLSLSIISMDLTNSQGFVWLHLIWLKTEGGVWIGSYSYMVEN